MLPFTVSKKILWDLFPVVLKFQLRTKGVTISYIPNSIHYQEVLGNSAQDSWTGS